MIIRKPYAILIKHFKLIHAILVLLMSYLVYQFYMISRFFNDYFSSDTGVIGQELTDGLFSNWMYIANAIIIIGLIVVLILMVTKKKPIKYYIAAIIGYIAVFVVLALDHNIIANMEIEQLSARTVRAMSDITLISIVVQGIILVLTFVRATGFNIKQFDFEKDLQELNITEEDREEVEVGINVDAGKFERRFRKNLRHIKYVYLENKMICNILIVVVILVTGYLIYTKTGVSEKMYKEGQTFTSANFAMTIEESYITNTNYQGNKFDNKTLLVLRMKIKNRYTSSLKFETARAELTIKGHKYYPNTQYYNDLLDFGEVYRGEKINSDEHYYILCYEIPTNYTSEKMVFGYVQNVTGIKNKLEVT